MASKDQLVGEREVVRWNGCYEGAWKGTITDDSFTHCAKMARVLTERIVRHCLDKGYVKHDEVIGDPFGGVGCVGVIAAAHDLYYTAVELEAKFVAIARRNFLLYPYTRERCRIAQGDSRHFAELIGACGAVVTSPPFGEDQSGGRKVRDNFRLGQSCGYEKQGDTTGNLAALPMGNVDCCLTTDNDRVQRESAAESREVRRTPGGSLGRSPPWERQRPSNCAADSPCNRRLLANPTFRGGAFLDSNYGSSDGQIGKMSKGTYWQAIVAIYQQCLIALKPGGVMCVVVGDFVRNGAMVPLCADTLRLLVAVGFEPLERIRAMQVSHDDHPGLFEENVRKTTARKSFFRLLAEKKGAPRKDWEEVLIVRKPR